MSLQTKNTHHTKIAALFLAAFVVGSVLTVGVSVVRASDITPGAVLRLTNEARKKEGLSELRQNEALSQAALAKAKDMFKNDYFAHTSPEGVTPWHWIKRSGYSYTLAGENLAINYDTASAQQKAWMKSPTHRANILHKDYQEMGVAVVEGKIDGKEARVTVQVFAKPKTIAVIKDQAPASEEPVLSEVKGVEEVEAPTPEPTLISDANETFSSPIPLQRKPKVNPIQYYNQAIDATVPFFQFLMAITSVMFLLQSGEAIRRIRFKAAQPRVSSQDFGGVFAFQSHHGRMC